MTPEQKQRALKALAELAQSEQGEELPAALKMAEVLQELIAEQPASVPVLTVECEPDYWSGGHYHEGMKPYIAPAKVWELPIGTKLYTAPAAPMQSASVPDWLETTRFLTDVTTAAGLLEHGRRDKGLARRIGDFANKYRMLAAAPAARDQSEQNLEMVRDAERYRWLRSYNTAKHPAVTESFFLGDENLDAAIDAAIAAEKGGQP